MQKSRAEIDKGSADYVYTIIIFQIILTWNSMGETENI